MSRYDKVGDAAKRVITLFFMVDVSGSMSGEKIGTVNSTMYGMLPAIRDISMKNTDTLIKIAVLTFSSETRWMTQEDLKIPTDVMDFMWEDLNALGITVFGKACLELNNKLSHNEFMGDIPGSCAPVIILLSDGEPVDEYYADLAGLQRNDWYRNATKAAIAIGNDVDFKVLEEFTGNRDNVVHVYDVNDLRDWLEFVTITAVEINSTGSDIIKNKNAALTDAILARRMVEPGHSTEEELIYPTVTGTLPPEPQDFGTGITRR